MQASQRLESANATGLDD